MNAKVNALVLLRRPEAEPMLRDLRDRCTTNGWLYALSTTDTTWGVTLVLQGEIGAGIRWIERAILAREREGYPDMAGVYRIYLCEIYLEIITGREKPPIKVLMRNFFTLAVIMVTAEKRIRGLVERVRQNPRFDPNGHHIGHCEMILGLLHKAKKKRALAVRHLTEARRIISQSGSTPGAGADRRGSRGVAVTKTDGRCSSIGGIALGVVEGNVRRPARRRRSARASGGGEAARIAGSRSARSPRRVRIDRRNAPND
jgi:hypothetical protein